MRDTLQVSSPVAPRPGSVREIAIEVVGLTKTYVGGVIALKGLSFCVEKGAVVAMLGPNGAGKSTAMRVLTTLSRPDSGIARVGGVDVIREPARVREFIGSVGQRCAVDLDSTGYENLSLQARLFGLTDAGLKAKVEDLLDRFELTDVARRMSRTYSGGMRRKLDVAMGLVNSPDILFLDEPTVGLDPKARAELWEEIARLSGEGITVLLATHYLDEADRLAHRVLIIDDGRLIVEGTPEELKDELHGDSVEIELASPVSDDRLRAALQDLSGLHDLIIGPTSIRSRTPQGATAAPRIILALETDGIRTASVKVAKPTLDDVYLRYTGRTFRQAEMGENS